ERLAYVDLDPVPCVRRRDEAGARLAFIERGREIAGTVRALERRIAAIAFDAVEELDLVAVLRHERAEARTHVDAQHEIGMRMTYFMPASAHHDREIARCGERRLIEPAKRQVGSYVQLQLVPGEHLVAHAYGVVIVRHH